MATNTYKAKEINLLDRIDEPLTWWQYLCQIPTRAGLISSRTPVSRLFDRIPRSILLAGLDEAGKSTILARYIAQTKVGCDIRQCRPTIGVLVEEVRYGAVRFRDYDLGGSYPVPLRHFKEDLIHQADAMVYVIDAGDPDRMMESREELIAGLSAPRGMRKGVPLLVLANKKDRMFARTRDQVEEYFIHNVSTSVGDRPWHVAGTNTLTGEGILEAFTWLSEQLDSGSSKDAPTTPTENEKGKDNKGSDVSSNKK